MDNSDILKILRKALAPGDDELAAIFELAGYKPAATDGNDPGGDRVLQAFLEGLILRERGPRADNTPPNLHAGALTNNDILKKLRIALNLQELDTQLVFEEGGASVSASEINALFRKPGNKHFRQCSDELLRQFLAGLIPSLES
jgi:uncharacterized protein YehS (DUF1456 family)